MRQSYRECMRERLAWVDWDESQAREWIAVPQPTDDKYSRGVLGIMTGSADYPGAAVLGVEAALRTGVGMVRYIGPKRPSELVLHRRPEAVTMPGRVQAWLLGSGMAAPLQNAQPSAQQASAQQASAQPLTLESALTDGLPTVLDAGALHLAGQSNGATVITPHHRELAVLLGRYGTTVAVEQIAAEPGEWASRAAIMLGVVVLLKGSQTHIASPAGTRLRVTGAPSWLATAGTGDVLAGILGALVATHSTQLSASADALPALAATAALLHAQAGRLASAGGPLLALEVAEAIPSVMARMLAA